MKNYRPLVFFGLLLLEIFCGRAVYADGYVNSYTYKNSSGEIVDLATKMNVQAVGDWQGDVFRVGNEKVECLHFNNGMYGLWNPITGALKTNPGRSCNLPPGSKFVIYPMPNSFRG